MTQFYISMTQSNRTKLDRVYIHSPRQLLIKKSQINQRNKYEIELTIFDYKIDNKIDIFSTKKIFQVIQRISFDSITQIPGNVRTTTLSDFNFGCSSFNNTCNTDGTLKYINNPVVSQCGNNMSNNKKNTIAANCDTTNMLYRREVSSASSINIDNDHKIMTMLRRTGCLTLPQYQMRMLNGYYECGDVNRRSQV